MNGTLVSLPGKALLEGATKGLIHFPRADLAILVPTPHQAVAVVDSQAHDGRGVRGLMERNGVLVTPSHSIANNATSRLERILELPHPQPALLPTPQLRLRARNVPQELPSLRLPQRVGPQLQVRRPPLMHC